MLKYLSLVGLSLLTTLALPSMSLAETVMERVAKSGVLKVGIRTNLVPYTYVNDKDELVGYTVDVVELIRAQLETELGNPVAVDYVVDSSFDDRMAKIVSEEVDLVCDTVFTWERDQFVDFSLAYSVSGIKLVTQKGNELSTSESLKGKRIGIVGTSLQERAIDVLQPDTTVVEIDSLEEGFTQVANGTIDAFAFDGIILEGMRQTMPEPDAFAVVPQESYFRHGIACMVPQGDSSFLDLVNYTIVKMMDGYLSGDSKYVEMINRSFGTDGIVTVDSERIRNFFETIVLMREQIPPTKEQ